MCTFSIRESDSFICGFYIAIYTVLSSHDRDFSWISPGSLMSQFVINGTLKEGD